MKKHSKVFYWLPRIICILAILFVSLFALDSFGGGKTIGQQLIAFLIHMIPSFILTTFLIAAWKWELIGGILFIVIGIVMSPIIFNHNYDMNQSVWTSLVVILLITFPFILVGALFTISHFKRNNESRSML